MNKKLNKLIVVGANHVFPWELKQELQVGSLEKVGANLYEVEINEQPFVFQLQETILGKDGFLINAFSAEKFLNIPKRVFCIPRVGNIDKICFFWIFSGSEFPGSIDGFFSSLRKNL